MIGAALPALVLLDTCALIWLANGEKLSEHALAAIRHARGGGGIFVSTASAWEIGMLARPKATSRPMPQFLPDPKAWFATLLGMKGMRETPITAAIAIDASFLPGEFHSDPMDRLIVATARCLGVPIMTRDRKILGYAEDGYVQAIPC